MKWISFVAAASFTFSALAGQCIPPHEYFPMEGAWVPRDDNGNVVLGMYSRISPDGRYVLRSFSGKGLSSVTIMELTKKNGKNGVKAYQTPMKNEAFPVQGSWRYLIDVGGEHYKMTDLLSQQKKAKKQFTGGISGFYTVAAELPGGTLASHRIRSLAWPSENSENAGVGVLSNKIITASIDKNGNAEKIDSSKTFYMCSNLHGTDGNVMSLPMISPDGSEFASMPQNPKDDVSLRLYRFGADNKDCEKVEDLKVIGAKVIFSYPQDKMVMFYSGGTYSNHGNGVYFYHREAKTIFSLNDSGRKVRADAFPGFARDGRIVYGATWEECPENGKDCVERAGYVVSDPYQSEDMKEYKLANPEKAASFKECITEEEVASSVALQDQIWSYK